ncbi:hypothetical protein LTR53_008207 [Teratosphaeriaceae sp. CCFEE 6253]|nr:hypothetical protein LTR53_008207 [Teratosphaeriaceae sp. CCFEE 6253]
MADPHHVDLDSTRAVSSHSAIFNNKKGTNPRPKKTAKAGGIETHQSMSGPGNTPPPKSSLPARPQSKASILNNQLAEVWPSEPAQGPRADDRSSIREYSAEARVYHCRYNDLSEAHDRGEHETCRQGCLELLTEPRLPRFTRIQTLQMLSTLVNPETAKGCLHDAAKFLDLMDGSEVPARVLREDNGLMLRDLAIWGTGSGGGGDDKPSEEWVKHDREVQRSLEADRGFQQGVEAEDVASVLAQTSLPIREKPDQ